MSPEVISSEISRLEDGDMTAMYIKEQNTCLLLYMRPACEDDNDNETKRLIVSTFPVQLDAETIANHSRSDIKVLIFSLFTNIFPMAVSLKRNICLLDGFPNAIAWCAALELN